MIVSGLIESGLVQSGLLRNGLLGLKGGAFSPASLFYGGTRGVWYDPSDINTLWQDSARTTPVTASGQTVGAMDDKSGNGIHLVQATASKRPVYTVSGGQSYLVFDGVDDGFGSVSVTLPAYSAYFFAVRTTNAKPFFVEQSTSASATPNKGFFIYGTLASAFLVTRGAGGLTGGYYANGAANWLGPDDAIAELQFGASVKQHYKDGVAQTLGAVTNNFSVVEDATDSLFLFCRNNASVFADGRFYGGLIVADPDASVPYAKIRTWLAAKQGRSL